MKRGKVLIIFLMLLLCVSFVSAGFFGDLFGRLFGGENPLTGLFILGDFDEVTLYEDTLFPQKQTRVRLRPVVSSNYATIDIDGDFYRFQKNEVKFIDKENLGIKIIDINKEDKKIKLILYTKYGETINDAFLKLEKGPNKGITLFNHPQDKDFLLQFNGLERLSPLSGKLEDKWLVKLTQNGVDKTMEVGDKDDLGFEIFRPRLSSNKIHHAVFIKPTYLNSIVLEEEDFVWVLNKGFFITDYSTDSEFYNVFTFDNGFFSFLQKKKGDSFIFADRNFMLSEVEDKEYNNKELKLFRFKRAQLSGAPLDLDDSFHGSLNEEEIEIRDLYNEIIEKIEDVNDKLEVLEESDGIFHTGSVVLRDFGKLVDSNIRVQNSEDSSVVNSHEYFDGNNEEESWEDQFIEKIPEIDLEIKSIEENVCDWVEGIENLPYGYLVLYQYGENGENEIICPNQLSGVETGEDETDDEKGCCIIGDDEAKFITEKECEEIMALRGEREKIQFDETIKIERECKIQTKFSLLRWLRS